MTPDLPANVHQVLPPLSRQPPSVFTALSDTAATSDPVPGSVTEMAHRGSPAARPGSQRCFCASVPPSSSACAMISGRVIRLPAAPREPRDSSSVTTTMPRRSSLPWGCNPPYRSGTHNPKQPSSLKPSMIASGTMASSRWIASANGATRSSANWRNVSRIIDFSSSRWSDGIRPLRSRHACPRALK